MTGDKYSLIFKTGDDLRQDQLIIQIIALMDRLLLNENLDLKLTPYRILATSTLAGAVQFVPSTLPVSVILQSPKYNSSILGYLRMHNPPITGSPSILGVRKDAMDNYVKSVAGYCVVHLPSGCWRTGISTISSSLRTGHFLHIDFGYILGRDPKPMAPLMKLSREMIEGMEEAYCFTSLHYSAAEQRPHSEPVLADADAGIPGLAIFGGEQAVRKVEERFKLDVSEEESVRFFAQMIEKEMGAWGPVLIDKLHGLTQELEVVGSYW
ncbi:hypothetical protein MRB53_041997 [Persea americana]|nr:hypothetical protein MRB53_041997 [Persea americana]